MSRKKREALIKLAQLTGWGLSEKGWVHSHYDEWHNSGPQYWTEEQMLKHLKGIMNDVVNAFNKKNL
jgi:hypothetical protein